MYQADRKKRNRIDSLEPSIDLRLKKRGEIERKAERRAERERLRRAYELGMDLDEDEQDVGR